MNNIELFKNNPNIGFLTTIWNHNPKMGDYPYLSLTLDQALEILLGQAYLDKEYWDFPGILLPKTVKELESLNIRSMTLVNGDTLCGYTRVYFREYEQEFMKAPPTESKELSWTYDETKNKIEEAKFNNQDKLIMGKKVVSWHIMEQLMHEGYGIMNIGDGVFAIVFHF